MKRSRLPSLHRKQKRVLLASAVCALTATLGHAAPLDPTGFTSLGPSPFVNANDIYEVDTSFDNPAPTIKQGATVIATGIFYDPTPTDTTNRDEIAVFTFDTIDLPAAVTLVGVRNANSRPAALLSKDSITVDGLIDFSGAQGWNPEPDGPLNDLDGNGGRGGAAGPGGGGGGGGANSNDPLVTGMGGGVGLVSGYPGENGNDAAGGAGGSVEPGGGGESGDYGGGGAFGGNGGYTTFFDSPGGTAYGDLTAKLEGGSGGAGSGVNGSVVRNPGSGGGGGGGAIELGAVSTLSLHGRLTTQGGDGGDAFGGAGGAGGGIILRADSVVIDSEGSVDASGGHGYTLSGGGGGGRVLIVANATSTAGLETAVNVTGGTSSEASPGSAGVVSTGTLNRPPQITCPQSTTISCAPASGLPVTISVAVSDPDVSQSLTITLKEGSTVLDTKSAATPATNLLVTFDPVLLSVMPHSLTVEVDDGTATNSCTTTVTVEADTAAPIPDLATLPTITGQCSAMVGTVPTATDACVGKINGTTTDRLSYSTQGTFTIRWTYVDGHGNSTIQTQTVIVQDTVAPTITACPPNQSANATSSTGAVVNYPAATATDNCAQPMLSYSHAAGTLFPIGDTKVTVTATDAVGNQATRTFNVHVKGATEQLSDLMAYVAGLSIDSGTKVSLQAKLTAAQSALAAGNRQDALSGLQDLINATSAIKGKKLTAAQANQLISDATRIRAVIGS